MTNRDKEVFDPKYKGVKMEINQQCCFVCIFSGVGMECLCTQLSTSQCSDGTEVHVEEKSHDGNLLDPIKSDLIP